jgi:hypothetical protein
MSIIRTTNSISGIPTALIFFIRFWVEFSTGSRRIDAAFIGHPLGAGLVLPIADERDECQEDDGEYDGDDQEQKKVPIVIHDRAVFPFPRVAEILND